MGAGHGNWVTHVAATPDGRYLVSSGNDGSIMLWSLPDGNLVRTMSRSGDAVHALALTADGRHIVASRMGGVLRVMRTSDAGQVWQVGEGMPILGVAVDNGG